MSDPNGLPADDTPAGGTPPSDTPRTDAPQADAPRTDAPRMDTARRFRRAADGGLVGGVAAGLARFLDVDVIWVRLAFVLSTVLAGGLGLVVYLAAWLVVPSEHVDGAAPTARSAGDGRGPAFWTGVALVAAGAAFLLDTLLAPLVRLRWFDPGDVLFPLVLIGVGALVWRSSRDRTLRPSVLPADDADVPPPPTGTSGDRLGRWADDVGRRAEAWGQDLERRAESWETRMEARAAALREARSRARVAPLTLGSALLVLGGVWLLASLEVPGMTVTRALAGALLVIGAGLLVGAFLGRGRGLILVGLLLTPVVLVATLVPQLPGGLSAVSVGEGGVILGDTELRTVRPADLADLASSYEFDAGSIVLDLRELAADEVAAAGAVRVDVELGAGELRVLLPADVPADVRVEVGVGRIEIVGEVRGGLGLEMRRTFDGGTGRGRIDLRISQGIGSATVTR